MQIIRANIHIGQKFALIIAFVMAINALALTQVSAAGMSNTYVRLDRMKAGTASSVRVVFTTSAVAATEDNIKLDFNYGGSPTWTGASGSVNATPGTPTTAACATETGATAVPGTLSAAGSGAVITISGVTNLSNSTAYCFDLPANSVVLPTTAGEYQARLTTETSTTIDDTAVVALRVVSEDQITVTASVPPTFNFQLDANTTAFTADLTPGTKRNTTPRTFTVNTNAKTGWVAWMRNSDTNGLYSVGVAKNIAPTTPGTAVDVDAANTTEQYVWGVTGHTQVGGLGTTSIPAAYDASGSNEGSGVDNSYRQVASSTGTTDTAVVTLAASATISGITPAASDYTDVVQVIGAGQF